MKGLPNVARRRRRVAIDAAMIMVILVLMVQMWLLTATLESFLAGHHGAAMPGLLASTALFGLCLFLYRLVLRIDRAHDRVQDSEGPGFGPWQMGDIPGRSRTRAAQHVDLVKPAGYDATQKQ
jgi:hypothetical protein